MPIDEIGRICFAALVAVGREWQHTSVRAIAHSDKIDLKGKSLEGGVLVLSSVKNDKTMEPTYALNTYSIKVSGI